MKRAMTPEPLPGGLAQLARAPALHAGGHRFESDILHPNSRRLFQRHWPCGESRCDSMRSGRTDGPNEWSLFKDIGPVEDHYVIRSGARKQEVLFKVSMVLTHEVVWSDGSQP